MSNIHSEKLAQAVQLIRNSGLDAWVTFVRETSGGGDPVLPLLIDGALTWQSALIVTKGGEKIAVVGNYDADPLKITGDWTEIVPYVQDFRDPFVQILESKISGAKPRIGVNFSINDVKADGLSHGMFLLLSEYLKGTRFEGSLESAEELLLSLRGQKTSREVRAMKGAVDITLEIVNEIGAFAKIGKTEMEVYNYAQSLIRNRDLGFAWDQANNPIVNSGPDSMIGHGIPSAKIKLEEGHIFHIDIGVIRDGYSSDLQRCWYVGDQIPPAALDVFHAVYESISAGARALKPGVQGWEVDQAARTTLVSFGYEEYLHALGHQVGRVAHDGGGILGPKWKRYGRTPEIPVQVDQVFTLELGVITKNRGYLGLEEMVLVREDGLEWLSKRQEELWRLEG